MLEEHALTAQLFEGINAHLAERGLLREGTMVDAAIIAAAPSTKNKDHARDPEMHQTKKGNEWHFGMKAHIGADADSGLVHSLHTTAANESDVAHSHEVLHGEETAAFLDAGYIGIAKREEVVQGQAAGKIRSDIEWNVAKRRSTITKMAEGTLKTLTKALERVKAQVSGVAAYAAYAGYDGGVAMPGRKAAYCFAHARSAFDDEAKCLKRVGKWLRHPCTVCLKPLNCHTRRCRLSFLYRRQSPEARASRAIPYVPMRISACVRGVRER